MNDPRSDRPRDEDPPDGKTDADAQRIDEPRPDEPSGTAPDGEETGGDDAGAGLTEFGAEHSDEASLEGAAPEASPSELRDELPPLPPPPPPSPATSRGRSMSVVLGFFALLVAVAAAGGAAVTWWQVQQQRETAAETAADLRSLVTAAEGRLAAQEQRLSALNRDADERRQEVAGLDSELRQARARLEVMAKEDASPERAPTLTEIEFLLLLAGRELALADNPKVALTALRQADQRLARMEDPGLSHVREAISNEIAAVEAAADLDLEGIAHRLGSLARRVEGLPLRASLSPQPEAERASDGEPSGWTRFRARLRELVAGVFRIRRTDTPAAPLLAPDESFFLYRNVELDLKSARLAVLARDQVNYAQGLQAARAAIDAYFETGDSAVQMFVGALEELESQEIAPDWPEITRSLELLRSAGTTE
jgi:uroporphyrin-III C-methyltransferase